MEEVNSLISTNMKNQTTKKMLFSRILLLLSLILFSPFRCLAKSENFMPFVVKNPTIINTLSYIAIYFIISVFALFIGCLIIGKKELIKSWKFLGYISSTGVGGFLISFFIWVLIPDILENYLRSITVSIETLFLVTAFIIFLILVFYNYLLARKILNLTKKQAAFLGIITGIFFNVYLIFYLFFFIWPIR